MKQQFNINDLLRLSFETMVRMESNQRAFIKLFIQETTDGNEQKVRELLAQLTEVSKMEFDGLIDDLYKHYGRINIDTIFPGLSKE